MTVHSVELLKARLDVLKAEIGRNEQVLGDKDDAKKSAEIF